jgi:adenylate cyclase
VISGSSTAKYKDSRVSPQQVGKELHARYVVEGGVRKNAENVSVSVQLIDAANGKQLWAEQYERPVAEFFDVETEVVGRIVGTLAGLYGQIARHELQRAQRKGTHSFEAHQLVLLSEQLNATGKREDQLNARKILERAIQLDPNYALAYANLSWTYTFEKMYHWGENPDASLERALELAQKAISLDEGEAESWYALGYAYLYKGDLSRTEEAFERGIAVNPNHANILADYGAVLQFLGRPEAGIASVRKAMSLNPYFDEWYYEVLGKANYTARRYEDAVAAIRRMAHPNLEARLYLAASLGQLGRTKEAAAEVNEILKQDPDASVAEWGASQPFKNNADLVHFSDGLRKAGLPQT